MVDFRTDVLVPAQQADEFIANTGGLPEIARAASDLRAALEQTRNEIAAAKFADRFPLEASDWFSVVTGSGDQPLTYRAQEAVAKEGEAGYKRVALEVGVEQIEHQLFGLIGRLVEIRCDLIVSQQDF